MGRRNLPLALGVIALGLAALALAACSEAGPQRAAAQLPELQVTISPAGCGEVAVAAAGSADTAFVYTSASPSTWPHASDTHLELRARAKAGCAFTRWVVAWGGAEFPQYGTTAKAQFLPGMTATAHFSGTPATPTPTATATATATATSTPAAATCTQTTLGVDPATNTGLAADCAALLGARDALRGTATLNWDAGTAMTSWDGVTLSGTPQRVTALALRMMHGTLPAKLGDLTALTSLSLEWGKLSGGIPGELGRLTKLRTLSLYRNNLGGGIPAELGKLTELRTLSLSQNFLTGGVPSELSNLTKLEGLFLYQNKLTGSIPAELEKLANLSSLYLSENQWTGCLPRALRAVANNDLATFQLPSCPLPATTLSYDTYDTAGRAMTAGSHALLADATAMTSVSNPFRGSAALVTALLVNTTDGDGTARSAFYDSIAVGDIVEWVPTADEDCWRRYRVTAVQPAPPGDPPRRIFTVEWLPLFENRCKTREIAGDAGSLAVELRWSPPAARRDSVTGLLTMLQQQPVGPGTYLVAPHALLVIDVPEGMMLVRTTGFLLSAGAYPVALKDVTSGSILVLDFDSGAELGRTMHSVDGDTRDVGALFDAIVTSARIFVERK
ncbi:MAG: hypothetical protein F4X76_00575 [Chloroflexi bacterium]|nr:hypothetical protein [Chloroflexota bacterium]